MFKRKLNLPEPGKESFFLWGPRQTGKSTLLRQRYPGGRWLDLLRTDEFRRYLANPERLRQEIEAEGPGEGSQIVIDEIQKVPALLDEVHWLIENRGLHFALPDYVRSSASCCRVAQTRLSRGITAFPARSLRRRKRCDWSRGDACVAPTAAQAPGWTVVWCSPAGIRSRLLVVSATEAEDCA